MTKARLLDKNFPLFTDNFYTKLPLAQKLIDRQTYLSGTMNKNTKDLSKTRLQTEVEVKQSMHFRKEYSSGGL